eukprot:GHVP01032841.1.p1 GENE.GHVP01032841.1~~GHVP01032841.1.p1  ORF type:complete len:945 (+),score=162.76 GHVP01032841.1:3404-6238(+)
MVIFEKLKDCSEEEVIVSVHIQPHLNKWSFQRLIVAAGSNLRIWAIKPCTSYEVPAQTPKGDSEMEDDEMDSKTITPGTGPLSEAFCLTYLTSHEPQYIVTAKWSPSGHRIASCDVTNLFVWVPVEGRKELPNPTAATQKKKNVNVENWKIISRLSDSSGVIFDACWFGEDRVATGNVDKIRIFNIEHEQVEAVVNVGGGFVKGVSAFGTNLLGVFSGNKRAIVYGRTEPKTILSATIAESGLQFKPINTNEQLLKDGPTDPPYYRRCSFDPLASLSVFPFGERDAQRYNIFAFGLVVSNNAKWERLDPVRFRGHRSRINVLAFSSFLVTWNVEPKNLYSLLAISSLDGALSIWRVLAWQPDKSDKPLDSTKSYSTTAPTTAQCLLVLVPRSLDEQAAAVDMTWASDSLYFIFGSDDGSCNSISIPDEAIDGKLVPTVQHLSASSTSPSQPFSHIEQNEPSSVDLLPKVISEPVKSVPKNSTAQVTPTSPVKQADQLSSINPLNNPLNNPPNNPPNNPLKKQVKRIAPIMLETDTAAESDASMKVSKDPSNEEIAPPYPTNPLQSDLKFPPEFADIVSKALEEINVGKILARNWDDSKSTLSDPGSPQPAEHSKSPEQRKKRRVKNEESFYDPNPMAGAKDENLPPAEEQIEEPSIMSFVPPSLGGSELYSSEVTLEASASLPYCVYVTAVNNTGQGGVVHVSKMDSGSTQTLVVSWLIPNGELVERLCDLGHSRVLILTYGKPQGYCFHVGCVATNHLIRVELSGSMEISNSPNSRYVSQSLGPPESLILAMCPAASRNFVSLVQLLPDNSLVTKFLCFSSLEDEQENVVNPFIATTHRSPKSSRKNGLSQAKVVSEVKISKFSGNLELTSQVSTSVLTLRIPNDVEDRLCTVAVINLEDLDLFVNPMTKIVHLMSSVPSWSPGRAVNGVKKIIDEFDLQETK